MKILVTGFTPFGGETINPSWEAVRALDDSIAGADIIKCEIPTEFEASIDALKAAIDAHQPNAILCVGQFGGSPSIQIERVAINLRDARTPDNAGFQPHDQPVVDSAPDAFFRRFRPGRSQIGSAQLGFPLRSPTPPGLMYATTCSMLRYMKARRQKKKTLHAAVLSMFPICPIRLLPPFPMLPV